MYNFSNLDKHILENIDKKAFGASVSIAVEDKVVFHKNYGYTSVSKQYPVTDNTVFRLASNTKIITAVAVFLCHQKGLLNVNDYVDQYLPGFDNLRIEDKDGNLSEETYRITIRQVLDHSSGFGSGDFESRTFDALTLDERRDLKTAVSHYTVCPLFFRPGSCRIYSGIIGFDVLARIVEVVSQTPYDKFVRENIFEPLDMTHTAFNFDNVKIEDKVTSSDLKDGKLIDCDDKGSTFDSFVHNYTGGGAGLISTVEDYMHLGMMLTNGGVYKGKQILSPEAYKVFTEKRRMDYVNGCVDYWGCGVFFRRGRDKLLPDGSFGWSGAYGTHYWSDPTNKITVVYMHNSVIFGYGGAGAEHTRILEDDVVKAMNLKYE